jgi:prevent-host-death family protein
MKQEVGAYEAKTRLPELLREVQTGREYRITNRGVPIADLVPIKDSRRRDSAAAVAQMKRFMLEDPVRGVDIKRLIEEGRP